MKATSMAVPYFEPRPPRPSDFRQIPKELAILNGLINEAWVLVHRLSAAGLRFAGTMEQATLTIAGSAYAAWRLKLDDDGECQEHDWGPTDMAAGFAEGIAYAIAHPHGVPAIYAGLYGLVTKCIRFTIDHEVPLEVMAEYWPDSYSADGLLLKTPVFVHVSENDTSIQAQIYDHRPNPLTTAPEVLRKANRSRVSRFGRLIKRRGSHDPRILMGAR
jgi:hypothetical protein